MHCYAEQKRPTGEREGMVEGKSAMPEQFSSIEQYMPYANG